MTLLDWLHLLAWFFFFYALITLSRKARHRRQRRAEESVLDEATARLFEAWNNDDSDINRLQDLSVLSGEVLYFEEDELGRWFPGQHDEVPPLFFDSLRATWETPFDHTFQPWYATPTRYWATLTVAPRQLEASPR